jgi:hypothetical protein
MFRFSVIFRQENWRHQQLLLGPLHISVQSDVISLFHVVLNPDCFCLIIQFYYKPTAILPLSFLCNPV